MNTAIRESRIAISAAADFGRVAVFYGGFSSEREVSLDTGNAVLEALQSRGVDAVGWDPAKSTMQQFAAEGFDRAWIALHGPGGEDGALQGALHWLNTPFTGSGVMASALAMDKVRSKYLFKFANIATPDYRVITKPGEAIVAAEDFGFPLVLKPAGQGSSVGMSMVFEAADLAAAAELAMSFDEPALAERCVVGDEMTIAILQGQPLPSIRIETPRVFYDYRAKYEADSTEYICPGTDDPGMDQLQAMEWVDCALDRAAGCERFELPEDRVGDIMIVSTKHRVLGTSRDRHDLSALKEPLRSHGGLTEQTVPLLLNRRTDVPDGASLRNFDIYDLALNHALAAA